MNLRFALDMLAADSAADDQEAYQEACDAAYEYELHDDDDNTAIYAEEAPSEELCLMVEDYTPLVLEG